MIGFKLNSFIVGAGAYGIGMLLSYLYLSMESPPLYRFFFLDAPTPFGFKIAIIPVMVVGFLFIMGTLLFLLARVFSSLGNIIICIYHEFMGRR